MSYVEYLKAQKAGQKKYQSCVSKGEYPYLPVLDEILSHEEILSEISLGLIDIPLEGVVGTSTRGRTGAFAANFMPLLDLKSEFGAKWTSLCESHMEEGIRDPIKVYEYMNKFYVVEGNKRVSVLKYFGAVTVPAYVTRKVPKPSENYENKLYYEFMDFYKITGINYLWFSKLGSFKKILTYTNTVGVNEWTLEQKKDFFSVYYQFVNAFEAKGGNKLPVKKGDALLAFMNIFDYDDLLNMTEDDMKEQMPKVWAEFVVAAVGENVDLLMNPANSKKNITTSIVNLLQNKQLKVAFVYDGTPETSDWLYGHELGRMYINEHFSENIQTCAIYNVGIGDYAEEMIEKVIAQGCNIVFTTTPKLLQVSLKLAVKYPDVKVLNCSLNSSHKYVRTYYARMYEAKFLTGIIAGSLAESDRIGYVADYPIYGNIANINAFALGAKFVNPRAIIYLGWSTEKGVDVDKYFRDNGISYVSDQDMITPSDNSRQFGLYNSSDGQTYNLAMPVYHWGIFYEKLLQSIISGTFKQENPADAKTKALNYWWGMSAGVIELICSKGIPNETIKLVEIFKKLICQGEFNPFSGILRSQNGIITDNENASLTPEQIMKMDWLLDNIVGRIPKAFELEDDAKLTVELKGVDNSIM